MDMNWENPTDEEAKGFDNHISPYLHYWLTTGQGGPQTAHSPLETVVYPEVSSEQLVKAALDP